MKKERDRAIYKLPSSLTNKRFNGNRVGRVKTAEEELFPPTRFHSNINSCLHVQPVYVHA